MDAENGGHALVEALAAAGVDAAFGVVSIHNLPLVEAVHSRMRFVPVRHEAAAVNAADGYARARGGLGCAITSTGTGAGNAAGSLVEALTASSPVLHVTGQVPLRYLGSGRGFIHETKDQTAMLAAVSRRAVLIDDPATARATLDAALTDARRPPGGPISVEWPIDLQYQPCRAPEDHIGGQSGAALVPPDPEAVADAVRLLASARRPALWVGGGARGCGALLVALADRLGAAVFTSNAGRGIVPEDHPRCVGNYAIAPAGQALLDEADVLLSVGSHFRSNETGTYRLRMPADHVQVDVDPDAIGRVYPVKVGVVGDAAAVLELLLEDLVGGSVDGDWPTRAADTAAEVRRRQRAAIGPQAAVCDAIRAALPRRGVIARDVTIASSSWGNRLLPIYDERDNLFARGGGIGQGLAMGVGAAIGRPETPVVVIAGDGGLVVHLGELYTLAEQRLAVTVVVFNDGGYGVLRNLQVAEGRPRAGVDLLAPDFALLAASAGMPYARITEAGQARSVLADAVASGAPSLVEVDVEALGPMAVPFVPPAEADADGASP
jgi:acetolactate synthase-1/2/3 large subunit